jgi:hypothetical protein
MLQGFALFAVVMVVWLVVYYLSYACRPGAVDAVARARRDGAGVVGHGASSTMWHVVPHRHHRGLHRCAAGIYLGLLFSFTVPVMVDEGLFGTTAMRRSGPRATTPAPSTPTPVQYCDVFVGFLLATRSVRHPAARSVHR